MLAFTYLSTKTPTLNRDRIRSESEDNSIADVMNWYTAINKALLYHLSEQIKEADNSGVWR